MDFVSGLWYDLLPMWTPDQIKTKLEAAMPGAEIAVQDLTGTSDHFQVLVVSDRFEGVSPVDRHRMVYDALGKDVGGAIHALAIKAFTPNQWQKLGQGS